MEKINLKLRVWRQKSPADPGGLVNYEINDVNPDMSFLEMLDVLNEQLIKRGEAPVEFESDCREGICGCCGLVIDGIPHAGKHQRTATCQVHMRHYKDGDTITIEPFRAEAFPVIKDLVVDRGAFDRIIAAGGYISANTGSAPDANEIPVAKKISDQAMDAAECIGCGACVAACPNASASLFVGAKISQLSLLPQGQPEREIRTKNMIEQMDLEGFGNCTNYGECEAVCPKGISITNIARMRREAVRAMFD